MQTLSAFFDRWIKLLLAFFSCCIDLICSCLWASRRKRINDASSSDLSHSLSLSSPPPLSPDHNGVIIAPSETSQTLLTNYDALSPWPHIKDAAAPPLCPGPDHALSLKLASFGPPPGWSHVTDRSARAGRWLAERGSRGRIIEVRVDEPPVGGGRGKDLTGWVTGAGGTNWVAPPVPRGEPARWRGFSSSTNQPEEISEIRMIERITSMNRQENGNTAMWYMLKYNRRLLTLLILHWPRLKRNCKCGFRWV